MHTAHAVARATARQALARRTMSPPLLLLTLSSTRSFATDRPLYGTKAAKSEPEQEIGPLASRLKHKRSANPKSNPPEDTAAPPHPSSPTSTTKSSESARTTTSAGPHKVRVPTAKAGDSAGESRKDRKRAQVEGFKAKRFAMLRLRREQAQAVAEAHGDDWLADQVRQESRRPLPRRVCPARRAPPGLNQTRKCMGEVLTTPDSCSTRVLTNLAQSATCACKVTSRSKTSSACTAPG